MIMKQLFFFLALMVFVFACGDKKSTTSENPYKSTETPGATTAKENPSYDPNRGEGKFTAENVVLGEHLDAAMAAEGEKVRELKCASCHKTTDEKLVGPGWKGVTQRRKPEWIMNFITNPDPMIDKDPQVQAQLEICLVRMPNQNLSETEARQVLEFMRKNDGVK
jgi:hypothetical protein